MKKYQINIKGVTPYMQHRMDDQKLEDWEKQRGKIIERELYDHKNDPDENKNIASNKEFEPIIKKHSKFISDGWKSGFWIL